MAEMIDEARIIAWLDGDLPEAEAEWMMHAVAADPVLAAMADRHRTMRTRDPAPVISLAAVRAQREAKAKAKAKTAANDAASPVSRWTVPTMIAASLIIGAIGGYGMGSPSGIADRPDALVVSPKIASALNGQLSGDSGTVRIALTFRDQAGAYCRSFVATHLSGIACRSGGAWQLRTASARGDIRTAGADNTLVSAMIAGEPLDRQAETAARDKGWR